MNDTGSGTLLTVAILGGMLTLTTIAIPSYMGLAARQSLIGAADAAALAAADAASGVVPGDPCALASTVASANGGRLEACDLDGYVVTVAVSRSLAGIRSTATATAGPPSEALP